MKKVCNICGKKVEKSQGYSGFYYTANGAVVGKYIEMKGHKTCVENVDQLVVIPNRKRILVDITPKLQWSMKERGELEQ